MSETIEYKNTKNGVTKMIEQPKVDPAITEAEVVALKLAQSMALLLIKNSQSLDDLARRIEIHLCNWPRWIRHDREDFLHTFCPEN